jgi:hypothetical protein
MLPFQNANDSSLDKHQRQIWMTQCVLLKVFSLYHILSNSTTQFVIRDNYFNSKVTLTDLLAVVYFSFIASYVFFLILSLYLVVLNRRLIFNCVE